MAARTNSGIDGARRFPHSWWVRWALVAIALVGLVGFIDLAVQQDYRQTANDPQIQLAEDGAAAIDAGTSPDQVIPTHKIDRETSLAPFVVVVNQQKQLIATNASYGSDSPLPPPGVFDNATTKGEQHVSWQTAQGQRYAAVVVADRHGYVLAARSLREVERRESWLRILGGLALVGLLAVTGLIMLVTERR